MADHVCKLAKIVTDIKENSSRGDFLDEHILNAVKKNNT
jgi:hypothetical protein